MALTNKRLKEYIHSNASSVIRSRANDCEVKEFSLINENEIDALVNGSSGITYKVTFSGLITGTIKSTCSCPFDHGPVCKHEVALANETEGFFSEKVQDLQINLEIKTESSKFSATQPYKIKIQDGYTIDDYIRLNATPAMYRKKNDAIRQIQISSQVENGIKLQVPPEYWSGSYKNIDLYKEGDELVLFCNCSALNKRLCKHQVMALGFIEARAPDFLMDENQIKAIKENLLNQYGFTLQNNNYKDYFSFEIIDGKYALSQKKSGLLRLSKFKDFEGFNTNFLSENSIIESQLPFFEKKKKIKKDTGIGLVFSFLSVHEYDSGIIILPIKGNLNKENNDIINKIEEIDADDFLRDKAKYTPKQASIIEKALLINADYSALAHKEYDKEKIQLKHLKELVDLLDETIFLYTLDDYYYSEKISRKNLDIVVIKKESPKLSFKVNEEEHFYVLKAYSEINNKKKPLQKNKSTTNLFFYYQNKAHYLYKSIYDIKAFIYFGGEPELRINKSDFESYYNEFIYPLSEQFEVLINHKKKKEKKALITDFKKQVYLSEHDELIVFKPVIQYNNKQVGVLSSNYIEENEGETIYKIKRDQNFETDFLDTIKKLHPEFKYQDESLFYLDKEDFIKDAWFLNVFEELKKSDIEVFGFDKLSKIKYNRHKPSISVNMNSGIDWFDVQIEIAFGDQQVSLKDVRKSIVNKENYVRLKDGTIGILPQEWVKKYSHAFRTGEVKKNSIEVSKYQLSVIDSLYDTLDATSEIAINHKKIKERLETFNEIENIKKPKGLKATLRDYQKEGLNWLNFLDDYNFGGCLADDMGLGKTLQIISFLKHLKNTKKPKNATLIVLPTSLIFNWQEEVKKFAPTLKYIVHTGGDREKTTEKFDNKDIVFTTYGILMRDISFLKEYTFNYCILDESQAIKNPNSQRFKAARLLKSNNKLVLTGTPIENNTFDLYAQMSFVNPGLLGTMANFKKEYATPIDKNKDLDAANDLRNLINPFLLRRTKDQVAKELPKKTEQVLYCTMEKEQQKVYDAYKNKYRNYLLNKIDEDGIGKSKMYVLEGLTKLRQICDSPQLLNDDEKYTSESIKIHELLRHVTEKTGHHKILIFSQFVKMLNLVKKAFDNENIKYEYLDGKTKDRQTKVENFQENDDIRVFLISLKAGGTGLNLTAADYVYLMDPWWNPAVEAQAIDRCYRIGQTKKVMAYKMICKGTIEEKIMQYQDSKKQLSADIIQTDESFVKALSKESITDLFS